MKRKAYSRGRLANPEPLPPDAGFDVTVPSDGRIHPAELSNVPVLGARRIAGRLCGVNVRLSGESIAAAVRADRNAR
jgi:hypothetical protein